MQVRAATVDQRDVAEEIVGEIVDTVRMIDPSRVSCVRAAMPPEDDVRGAADTFALLGDPSRLRLVIALLEGVEMCVCDIAAATGQSESGVSHALRLLRAQRIVSVSRRGRMAYYRLEDAHVRTLLDIALTHAGDES